MFFQNLLQNWKESARFPRYFKLGWDKETDYYAGDISELYGEIMTGEAVFVGIFEKRCNRSVRRDLDVVLIFTEFQMEYVDKKR